MPSKLTPACPENVLGHKLTYVEETVQPSAEYEDIFRVDD